MLQSVRDDVVEPSIVIIGDNAWLHLRGSMNFQNSRYWDTENTYLVHEVPLQD
ncbi:hypothetical protein C0J52_20679 [Blattella germanica]|nr:hypothetical protein C0J52_20679 [Blattella germanica]